MATPAWDLLIRGGRVFDGHGGPAVTEDIALSGGRVAARGPSLPAAGARRIINASGRWVMPGLLDIHTHYDLEVELDPSLPESMRHGVTTVVMSNCSLGLAFGNQRHLGADPIVDCFARVENIPKPVLSRAGDVATWSDPAAYLEHLDTLALGPNVVPMVPHSMLRIQVMGLDAAITRAPSPAELERMTTLLEDALRHGYAGFSTDALPFHYLANDPNRQLKIPTQYATFGELRALTDVARRHDRVWQTTPPKDSPLTSVRHFALTSGRLHGRPLKVTAVAALDVVTNRALLRLGSLVSTVLNSALLGGRFFLQALPARFKVWSDGPVTPLAEEVPVLRELNEPDLEDRAGRLRVLDDRGWQARFRRWWTEARRPLTRAWLRRILKYEDTQFERDLGKMTIDRAPVSPWHGETLAQVRERLLAWQRTGEGARDASEAEAFAAFPTSPDEVDFLISLLRQFDTGLSWWVISANEDLATVTRILDDERFLPGFSDAGAHITNMAFYDVGLRALQIAATRGEEAVSRMVRRLTLQPARFFGLDVGTLDLGAPADLVVIDPVALARHDGEASVRRVWREAFQHEQLVNRSDGVVAAVVMGGKLAMEDGVFADVVGRQRLGRCLRAGALAVPPAAP